MKGFFTLLINVHIIIFTVACSTTKNDYSGDYAVLPPVNGIANARFYGDLPLPDNFETELTESLVQQILSDPNFDSRARSDFLVLSGGGQDGAYAAGLLNGWSAAGTKPEFRIITGVSTGAIIAVFAFLGSAEEDALRESYTQYSTKDLFRERNILALLFSDSLYDNKKFRKVLKYYFTPEVVENIALEHNKGRRLYIASTLLNVERPVIWDLGAIASSGHPAARDTIIDAVVASASIPLAFPASKFTVNYETGQLIREIHVDGGVVGLEFLNPVANKMVLALEKAGQSKPANITVMHNEIDFFTPFINVKRKLIPIALQSIQTAMRENAINSIGKIYNGAAANGMPFRLSLVPTIGMSPNELFDKAYMNALYNYAYEQARGGDYPWLSMPPFQ